ncbi:MAG: hypothetical protein J6S67_17620 [Methanobrevibacter sp.]|nr:hypothetical protein [Methanobrevibacter sp.]
MVTVEDIKRIAKTGEHLVFGNKEFWVYKNTDSYDVPYWCLSYFERGKGGWSSPFAQRLTSTVIQRMIKTIEETYGHN